MRKLFFVLLLITPGAVTAQPLIQAGNVFPNYVLRPVINAPLTQVDLWKLDKKYIILNFWGTWCAPCIPEMDSLARLQQKYSGHVQVIAVSNDPVSKLQAYLKKKPTRVWLASDTTSNLYRQAGFKFVGQSIILDPEKRVIALIKTDSINAAVIEKIISGKLISSNAETEWQISRENLDPFGVDSTTHANVSMRSYMPGKSSMSLSYLNTPLEGRRMTFYNVCPTNLFRNAYDIGSLSQIVYELDKNRMCNYSDNSTLLCFDLLVKPSQKDSLKIIMQQKLNALLPYKAKMGKKEISVYVLTQDSSGAKLNASSASKMVYSYSGNGFSGTAVPIQVFAEYLSNEAGLPVVDETGLKGSYDIETKLVLRTKEEVLNSLKNIGLVLKKTVREMPVLIIYQ